MQTNEITIRIEDEADFWDDAQEQTAAIDAGEQAAFDENTVTFTSLDQMRSVLTEKRLELLRIIRRTEPESIYGLAQAVDRSPANVNQDIQLLNDLGLVTLERLGDARDRVTPTVTYETMHVEIRV